MTKVLRQSRFRLADYVNQPPQYYHATFGLITHKKTGRAVILLKDLYFVDKDDRKIRLAKDNDQVDKKGRHIVADHVWINLTKPWLNLKTELLDGDEVMFKASVAPYKITRSDTVAQRQAIWQKAKVENELLWERYEKHKRSRMLKKHEFDKLKQKQHANLMQAAKEESEIKLVDYSLNRITNLKVVNYKRVYYHTERQIYDPNRIKDQKYTKFLAWHSMDYSEKRHHQK